MNRQDYFNLIVGVIFVELGESFPVPIDIDQGKIADIIGISKTLRCELPLIYDYGDLSNGDSFLQILWYTLGWLRDEGFIRAEGDIATRDVVLTKLAHTVLNTTPDVLTPTLGSKLAGVTKKAGGEAAKAAIAELVGQAVGSFTKAVIAG